MDLECAETMVFDLELADEPPSPAIASRSSSVTSSPYGGIITDSSDAENSPMRPFFPSAADSPVGMDAPSAEAARRLASKALDSSRRPRPLPMRPLLSSVAEESHRSTPPPLSALALQLQLWSADERAQSPAPRRPTPGSVAEGKVRGGQPVGVWPGEKVRGGVGAWPRLAQVA